MDSVFLIISMVSIVVFAVLVVIGAINLVKRDKAKAIKSFKNSGISVVVAIATFIGFGVTYESEEIAEPVQNTVAVNADEPEEEKEQSEEEVKKAAEDKAAAEQKAKEEAEAKLKAEEEARIKAEQEEKARQEQLAAEQAAKKASAQTIDYAHLKKNPDRYKGEYVKYTGEIIQILEGNNITNIRLAVTKTAYGYDFNDVIFIEYNGYTDYVDGDIITMYGEVYGTYSYESQAGFNISLPGVIAKEFE